MIGREVRGLGKITHTPVSFVGMAVLLTTLFCMSGVAFAQQAPNKGNQSFNDKFDVLDPFTMQMVTISKAKTSSQKIVTANNIAKTRTGPGTKVEIPRRPSARSPFVPPSWVPGAKYGNAPGWLDTGWLP
jgi:hypothetical protein